ncbi:molybdopterin-synthase adenylyltransferase MoeB [Marisediminicola senii]|uniref:molybdopterin-synthase adenylyltransferase MoeB n=1 Tax=Marisediminicola senii TaxID=2711233 RepID=UPI0013EDE45A|nr:molybdopterin-synthase adenylyltransferase MoeB [Marisediminicola senii]
MPLLALQNPVVELSREQVERGSRHIMLPGLGVEGQQRLAAARVLVIGAGGLGSPALQYLAASGIGTIGIVDFDVVDTSNLQRQVIHRTSSIGEKKTASAARGIAESNPLVDVHEHDLRLNSSNALDLFAGYDLILDGSDNFATRYLANDAAAMLGMPYVWGSVYRFDGQVTVFWENAPDGRSLDYRDLHPTPPAPGDVLSCDEAGVLGSVCGTIGSMMATEAIKLITGVGEPLLGRVQTLDALAGDWREMRVSRSPGRQPVTGLIDYALFCGVPAAGNDDGATISVADLVARGTDGIVDVRESFEWDIVRIEGATLLPLAELLAEPGLVRERVPASGRPVVVYCKSGVRSAAAVAALGKAGIDAVSLRGGIQSWLDLVDPDGQRY